MAQRTVKTADAKSNVLLNFRLRSYWNMFKFVKDVCHSKYGMQIFIWHNEDTFLYPSNGTKKSNPLTFRRENKFNDKR